MTFIGSVEEPFPENNKTRLDEGEHVLLGLNDTLVEVRLVLDEEGL